VQLRKVSIVAPRLKKLIFCAIEGFVQNFSVRCFAPKVENLNWSCRAPDVCFGDIWCLMDWNIKTSEPLRQLQHHPPSNTLSLNIFERSMVILLCPFLLNFSSVLTKLTSYWYLMLPNCWAVCSWRCPELWELYIIPPSRRQLFCSRGAYQLTRTCLWSNGPAPTWGIYLDREA
jgi:hypothetical protein